MVMRDADGHTGIGVGLLRVAARGIDAGHFGANGGKYGKGPALP
jgi:hypothetical protein